MVKPLPTMRETQVQSLGREDPVEKEMATHSGILAWRIHGWRSLVGYSPRGHKESETTEPLPFLPEKSSGSEAFSTVFLLTTGRIILPEIKGH